MHGLEADEAGEGHAAVGADHFGQAHAAELLHAHGGIIGDCFKAPADDYDLLAVED